MLNILPATLEHLEQITNIYNEAVLNSIATFDTEPKSVEEQRLWFNEHGGKYPILVAEENNTIVGWASLSRWSGRCAYADTAEISIYIKDDYREQGKNEGLHTVLARIADGSEGSIQLHKKAGFEYIGVMKEVGKKFGKLLDVHMMQLIFK
jgi:L-amino acid N-acyltransferase YncA